VADLVVESGLMTRTEVTEQLSPARPHSGDGLDRRLHRRERPIRGACPAPVPSGSASGAGHHHGASRAVATGTASDPVRLLCLATALVLLCIAARLIVGTAATATRLLAGLIANVAMIAGMAVAFLQMV
jgi:hypothetical protein